jgi:tRNA modification GTPase
VVRTKADLAAERGEGLPVSVLTGEGLGGLRRAAAERVFADRVNLTDLEPVLTRERHRVALTRAQAALDQALPHLGRLGDAVLAAHHVREATQALDELLGVVDIDEVLDRVFAAFCVGK